MLSHVLFDYAKRKSTETSSLVATAERDKGWKLRLLVARITGSVTIVVETSPSGDDGTWTTLHTFTVSATGVTEVVQGSFSGDSNGPDEHERYLRARLTVVTDATFRLTAEAPFLDPATPAHLDGLTKELREFSEMVRVVAGAEDDVLRTIISPDLGVSPLRALRPDIVDGGFTIADQEVIATTPHGVALDALLDLPGFGGAMRREVARQAEHVFRRYKVEQGVAKDKNLVLLLREMGPTAPGLGGALKRFLPTAKAVWRGR